MTNLASRNCVPCRGGVPPLTPEEYEPLLALLEEGWRVEHRASEKHGTIDLLSRRFKFSDFIRALAAANTIGAMAEEQQHHPDLYVAWGTLGVEIWTHKIGGLTESDFVFAAKCDALLGAI